ncbi:hypothetical protein [Mesorhizobium sp. IMUNJ 23232]|uniref:hypothetical protein n=1 Tax=Mesorhizobium sp. IMUNJ 23232 TaxID=3376064 RepID=UPI0037BDF2E0
MRLWGWWKDDHWKPATRDGEGRELFTERVVIQLCLAQLAELGHECVTEKRDLALENVREIMGMPDLRLGYELVAEIVAERLLTSISAPKAHKYFLSDMKGHTHSFDLAEHPVYAPVHAIIEHGMISGNAIRELGRSAAYTDVVSKALNAGEKLDNLTIYCAPVGLIINSGKLEIKPGCEIE